MSLGVALRARPGGRGRGTAALTAGVALVLALSLAMVVSITRPVRPAVPVLLADSAVIEPLDTAAWLAAGSLPAVPELGDSTMVADALRDLHALSQTDGVPVAGQAGPWRYVWPRDSALVAAALARTGHRADAEQVLTFLQRVQPASGVFQARYLPDGSGPPDGRGTQLDGTGWALWGAAQVADALPAADRAAFVRRHRRLLDTSSTAVLAQIDNRRNLPKASADYWERTEWRLTLATAALLHAGLLAAAELYAALGELDAERSVAAGAGRLGAAIARTFGPDGYPRHAGGGADTVDLGVCFLLPPFSDRANPGVVQAWRHAGGVMTRPAGGLAPGGSWRDDGISWTTATSSYALTAAAIGDRDQAVAWLRWLDRHRTGSGSLPEKVTAAGHPAAVAPLAWTAAAVILTAHTLGQP